MNVLEARRRLLGADVEKKTAEGNPISVRSLARMYPGIEMEGWTEQNSTTGAQLLDADQYYAQYKQDDGTYAISANEIESIRIPITTNMVGKQYTFSASGIPAANDTLYVQYFKSSDEVYNGNVIVGSTSTFSQSKITFTPEETGGYIRISHSKLNDGIVQIKDAMLNLGAAVLPWEPYTGGAPSPSPEYPQEIVSAGTQNQETGKWEYEITIANAQTDPDKNQTVTLTSDRPLTKWDKLTKKNGVWGWEYGSAEIVFDGSDDERWNEYASRNGFNIVISGMLRGAALDGFCDKLIISKVDVMDYPTAVLGSNNNDVYIKQVSSYASDVNAWKTWLQSNPITVLYQLAEPVFVPLSETEQTQMNALHTFRPTTVLSNDAFCEMMLKYKTKKSLEVTA